MVLGGKTPPTACLARHQRLPETCCLSLPRTPTLPTLLPPKGLQQRGPSLPSTTKHYSQAGGAGETEREPEGEGCRSCLKPRTPSAASPNRKPKDVSRVAHR